MIAAAAPNGPILLVPADPEHPAPGFGCAAKLGTHALHGERPGVPHHGEVGFSQLDCSRRALLDDGVVIVDLGAHRRSSFHLVQRLPPVVVLEPRGTVLRQQAIPIEKLCKLLRFRRRGSLQHLEPTPVAERRDVHRIRERLVHGDTGISLKQFDRPGTSLVRPTCERRAVVGAGVQVIGLRSERKGRVRDHCIRWNVAVLQVASLRIQHLQMIAGRVNTLPLGGRSAAVHGPRPVVSFRANRHAPGSLVVDVAARVRNHHILWKQGQRCAGRHGAPVVVGKVERLPGAIAIGTGVVGNAGGVRHAVAARDDRALRRRLPYIVPGAAVGKTERDRM